MTDNHHAGQLKQLADGSWTIVRGDQAPVALTEGELFRLATPDGRMQVRRMERINGIFRVAEAELVDGAEAAIGIEG